MVSWARALLRGPPPGLWFNRSVWSAHASELLAQYHCATKSVRYPPTCRTMRDAGRAYARRFIASVLGAADCQSAGCMTFATSWRECPKSNTAANWSTTKSISS